MHKNDVFYFLQETMNTLMLKHWGIVLIKGGRPLFVERKNEFDSDNSIFDNLGADQATVVAIAVPYLLSSDFKCPDVSYGKIENFAWDYDYHIEVKKILMALLSQMETLYNRKFGHYEICVDQSPYNDREVGFYAGLGSIGKNHLLIHPQLGTHFFIGYIVIMDELLFNQLPAHQHVDATRYSGCETCDLCLKACPTKVCGFEGVDIKKCLSELTQTKAWISEENREVFNKQIYGCSICQEVCPSNRSSKSEYILSGQTQNWVELFELLNLTSAQFKARYGKMGFAWRSLWVYKRNALIVLSGTRNLAVLERLKALKHLENDEHLGEYYKWAINRLCISTADR
ncbi:epoxyqueuosine reductase [Fusibacter bizertensis]